MARKNNVVAVSKKVMLETSYIGSYVIAKKMPDGIICDEYPKESFGAINFQENIVKKGVFLENYLKEFDKVFMFSERVGFCAKHIRNFVIETNEGKHLYVNADYAYTK